MKLLRLLSRLAVLSLIAAGFVGLTEIYGGSVQVPLPSPRWQEVRQNRPSAPEAGQFPEFVAAGVELALFAVAGRMVFRLRLSPVSRNEGSPIFLNLYRESRSAKK